MRLFLDENVPPLAADPLRAIYREHEFATAREVGLTGVPDVELFERLSAGGFDAIITRDRNQLRNEEERSALRSAGLHWIGIRDRKLRGLAQITITVATLMAGIRFVVEHERNGPTAFALKTVPHDSSQRLSSEPL